MTLKHVSELVILLTEAHLQCFLLIKRTIIFFEFSLDLSKENSKETIVRFINRKHCKCALVNRKNLKHFNSDGDVSVDAIGDISMQPSY